MNQSMCPYFRRRSSSSSNAAPVASNVEMQTVHEVPHQDATTNVVSAPPQHAQTPMEQPTMHPVQVPMQTQYVPAMMTPGVIGVPVTPPPSFLMSSAPAQHATKPTEVKVGLGGAGIELVHHRVECV